jgi:hypothetical protein
VKGRFPFDRQSTAAFDPLVGERQLGGREQLLRTTQWLIQLERNRRSSVQSSV